MLRMHYTFLFYRSLFVWWPILSIATEQETSKIMGGYLQSSTNFLGKVDEIHPIPLPISVLGQCWMVLDNPHPFLTSKLSTLN